MKSGLILFFISALPVFLLGLYIYKKDRNREPIKLLIKLFGCGILSVFLVVLVSKILENFFPIISADYSELNLIELMFLAFVMVALVEESCKWIFSYKIAYNHRHFEETFDMIVYSAFVALGFAFFENLLYVYEGGLSTGIIRAISAVPMHACCGIFMGSYLGLAKQIQSDKRNSVKIKYIICSILVPTILHGMYDYCAMANNNLFGVLFLIVTVLIFVYTTKRIKKMSLTNRKMEYVDKCCPNCGIKVDSSYCPNCGRENH